MAGEVVAAHNMTLEEEVASLEAGLDALETRATADRRSWRQLGASVLPPVLALGLLLAVWQLVCMAEVKPSYMLPSPADVFGAMASLASDGVAQDAVFNSLSRAFVGFGISLFIGTALGLILANVTWFRRGFGPLITGLMVLPSVAWVPAAILWFGISAKAMLFVVVLGAAPSIANGLVSGIGQIPTLYPNVGKVLGARGISAVWHITMPAALPGYLGGLRQGWAFAWRSLMAAELIAFSPTLGIGLGQLLQQGRELSDMPTVMASILLILLVGVVVELCVFAPLERRVLRQRGLLGTPR